MTAQAPQKNHQPTSRKSYLFSNHYAITLWISLVLLALLIGVLQHQTTGQDVSEQTGDSKQSISPALLFTSRYFLGLKASGILTQSDWAGNSRAFILQLEDMASSSGDRICLTPMIAELIGRYEALAHLDRIKQDTALSTDTVRNIVLFSRIYSEGSSSLSRTEREELLENYGWFARLALSHDLDDTSIPRSDILTESGNILQLSLLFMTVGALFACAGLILSIYTVVMIARKRLSFAYTGINQKDKRASLFLLETMVLYLLFMAGTKILSGSLPRMFLWLVSVPFVISILFWPRWRGMSLTQLKTALGWHRGKGVFKETCSGVLGYLAGLPVIIGGLAASLQIIKLTGGYPVHPIVYEVQNLKGFQVIWIYMISSVIAPIIEESLFRGALYQALRARLSIVLSACVNGFLFAVIHPQGAAAIPALGAIGLLLCLIREWRDSLLAPITAHALNNFIVTSMLFFMF